MVTGTASTVVDTFGRRVRVEWGTTASATPMGQVVYFSQFLTTAGLFSDWVKWLVGSRQVLI